MFCFIGNERDELDFSKWLKTFDDIIANNLRFSKLQEFLHLKASLKYPALSVTKSLSTWEENLFI